jgi:uncharacterized protein (DUF58 family)
MDIYRIKFISLLTLLLMFFGVISIQGNLILLTLPLILAIGSSKIFPVRKHKLTFKRNQEIYRSLHGSLIQICLNVTNEGPDISDVKIEDLIPASLFKKKGDNCILTPIASGKSIQLRYSVYGNCGTFELTGVEITQHGFLNLSQKSEIIKLPGRIINLPHSVTKKRIELKPQRTSPRAGDNLARIGGEGVEFYGVREYQPGDPIRYINNRASARHSKILFINEFERKRIANVIIMMDTQNLKLTATDDNNLMKYSFQIVTYLSETLLNSENRVGLYIFGNYNNWVFPGCGKVQKEKMRQTLAFNIDSLSRMNPQFESLPLKFLSPSSLILMVSPLLNKHPNILNTLKVHRHQVMVLSPDLIAFEKTKLHNKAFQLAFRVADFERNLKIRQLNKSGIPILNLDILSPFETIINRFLGQ